MQTVAGSEALDREHLAPVHLPGEHETRVDRLAVHDHRARATVTHVAAQFRPGQPEMLAQELQQRRLGRHGGLALPAIDAQHDIGHFLLSF